MAGYGHKATNGLIDGQPFFMDTWAGPSLVFIIDGKRWLFEDSDMFGPSVLRWSDHHPRANQPGSRSRFWDAYGMWRKAGRPVKMGKIALWKEPQPGTYWKDDATGLSHFLTDPDLEDGPYVRVEKPTDLKEPK